eukprot:16436281-Heterocapsa_arctica.AAC.1
MMHLSSSPSTRYLAAQLACAIGGVIEDYCLSMASGCCKGSAAGSFEWLDWCTGLDNKGQFDKQLHFYVQACKNCREDWQFVSLASDKGDGGGLPLMQTVFAFPDNQAFVAIPQAAGWGRGRDVFGWPDREFAVPVSIFPLGLRPSQVDKGFDDGTDLGALEEVGFRGKKRARGESPAASVPPRTADQTRHRAWLTRGSSQGNAASWRPKPVYRVGAKRVLAELDNQVRQSCPFPGLKHFQPCPEKTGPRSCWRTWPHISVTHDLGSEWSIEGLFFGDSRDE